jgi:hypothetical protein
MDIEPMKFKTYPTTALTEIGEVITPRLVLTFGGCRSPSHTSPFDRTA